MTVRAGPPEIGAAGVDGLAVRIGIDHVLRLHNGEDGLRGRRFRFVVLSSPSSCLQKLGDDLAIGHQRFFVAVDIDWSA